jgi:DNA primase
VGPEGVAHLALDADASGQEAMLRAAELAERRGLRLDVVPMPAGTDPADLVRAEGADAVRGMLGAAVPLAQFQVERVLATADLDSTAGRDRAFERLRVVIGRLEPSPQREDLVRLVAGRLALSEQLAGLLTVAPAAPGLTPVRASAAEGVLDRRAEVERTFLSLCLALPEQGREALRRVDLDAHFSSPALRRAAGHLRDHLSEPLGGAEDDPELSSLLAELTLRAAREPVEAETLQVQQLQLEMARLEREIASARAGSSLDVSQLAAERERVKRDLDSAVDRATEKAGRA